MFNRVATATVIRGNGACHVYMNNIVSEEMKRQEALRRTERRATAVLTRAVIDHRDRLRDSHRAEINARLYSKPNLVRRIRDAISNAWALCWATVVFGGEALGLWERVGDDGER